jgi:hypothetical protein
MTPSIITVSTAPTTSLPYSWGVTQTIVAGITSPRDHASGLPTGRTRGITLTEVLVTG